MGKNQHVVPRDGKWAVRGEGNSRVSSEYRTQGAAINSATRTARNEKSEVVIHGRDGKIRDKDSYGHDPLLPRNKSRLGSGSYHVVTRYDGKWGVRKTGDTRASWVFDNEKKAISVGRSMAKDIHGEIIIHDSDGRVRSADSYGRDPCPPGKGRK
jgi:hypothetical protein